MLNFLSYLLVTSFLCLFFLQKLKGCRQEKLFVKGNWYLLFFEYHLQSLETGETDFQPVMPCRTCALTRD